MFGKETIVTVAVAVADARVVGVVRKAADGGVHSTRVSRGYHGTSTMWLVLLLLQCMEGTRRIQLLLAW